VYGYNDFVYTYLSNGQQYGYGNVRQPFSYAAQIRNIGAFIDDSIRIGDRLTLNLGVRGDHSNGFAPEQQELDENAKPTGKTFRERTSSRGTPFPPRLGVNWKLTPTAKRSSRTHWGRYHPQITTGEFANVIGPNIPPFYQGNYNFATGQVEDLFLTSSSENLSVASNYRSPRTDQFIIGFERELTPKMGLQVDYVRKWGRDFSAWRDTVGTYIQVSDRRRRRKGSHRQHDQHLPLTSDPSARKYQLENSDDLAHRHPRGDRQPDQTYDPLVRQRGGHLLAIDRSARRKLTINEHSTAECPGVQHLWPQPQRFRQPGWAASSATSAGRASFKGW
jgi:hypothetical protein